MSFATWIKFEITTPDKPEVVSMAARLKFRDADLVTGKLVRIWGWADLNSVDGSHLPITRAFIDRLVSCRGFAAALEAVGWLSGPDGDISFTNFDRHNGDSAKKRAVETRKKQRQREGRKGAVKGDGSPPEPGTGTGTNVPPDPGQKDGQEGGLEEELELENKGINNPAGGREIGQEAIRIVSHYPRREKMNAALEIVAYQLRQGEDAEAMLAGTKAASEVIRGNPAYGYFPSAESFFRDKRWADDPATLIRNATRANAGVSDDAVSAALGGRADE